MLTLGLILSSHQVEPPVAGLGCSSQDGGEQDRGTLHCYHHLLKGGKEHLRVITSAHLKEFTRIKVGFEVSLSDSPLPLETGERTVFVAPGITADPCPISARTEALLATWPLSGSWEAQESPLSQSWPHLNGVPSF